MRDDHPQQPAECGSGSFLTTRWSLVRLVGEADSNRARGALNELCRMYWYPLYCYVRRRGYPPTDAEDLVQSFFVHILDRELFALADHAKGKLRGFLLSSLQYFLLDQRKRVAALKRGGAIAFEPLNLSGAEERFSGEIAVAGSPEGTLDRAWALELLQRALRYLAENWKQEGKSELFEALRPFLLAPLDAAGVSAIAARFSLTETNVKVSLHRLRERYRAALRQEVSETVSSEREVDEEIAALWKALSHS